MMRRFTIVFFLLLISVLSRATAPFGFTGDTLVCIGDQENYVSNTSSHLNHTYSWSVAGGTIIFQNGQGLVAIDWFSSGLKTVTLVEHDTAMATMDSTVLQVQVNPLPTATISGGGTICMGGAIPLTFTMTGTGPWNITYDDGTFVYSLNNITSPYVHNVSPSSTVTFGLQSVVQAVEPFCAGVTMSGSATVTVNPLPTGTMTLLGPSTICAGDCISMLFNSTGNGPFDIVYLRGLTPVALNNIPGFHVEVICPTGNTNYTLSTVRDNNVPVCNGTSVSGSASITVEPIPHAVISGSTTICEGDFTLLSFALTGTAPFDVDYTDGVDTFSLGSIFNGHLEVVTPTLTTSYTIIEVTDNESLNCPGTFAGTAVVTVNPKPTVSISGTTSICAGQSANLQFALTGNGPFDVVITDNGGFSTSTLLNINNGHILPVSPTSTKTYNLINVFDNSVPQCDGDPVSGSAVITVNPLPTAVITGTRSICVGDSAPLTFNLTGNGPFDVTYFNGTSSTVLTNISNGHQAYVSPSTTRTYTITAVNDNSAPACNGTAMSGSAVITVSPVPTGNISGSGLVCHGTEADLTFTFTGTGPFDAVFTDGTSLFNLNNVPSGHIESVAVSAPSNFTLVSVTGNTPPYCAATTLTGAAFVTVTNPINFSLTRTPTGVVCESSNIDLISVASGGTGGPFTTVWEHFGWSAGLATETVAPTLEGWYRAIAFDANACPSSIDSVFADLYNPLLVTAIGGGAVCEGESVSMSALASGGKTSYSYSWNNGAGTSPTVVVTPSVTTNYTVTVTDACATMVNDVVPVNIVPAPPVPSITELLGLLTSSSPSGNKWLFNGDTIVGATSDTLTIFENGEYQVVVTVNGCSSVSAPVIFDLTWISEPELGSFTLFPNPVQNDLFIQADLAGKGVQIIVSSLTGAVVMEDYIPVSGVHRMPMTNLSPGMYMITFRTDEAMHTAPLIKR